MRHIGRFLWIAATPLALTLLFAAPDVQAAGGAPTAGVETEGGGGSQLITNPILNWFSWDYKGKEVHGHKMPPPFSMALLNFGVFVFLIGKLAGPSIKRMVRDRHETIAKQLAESARLRDEAKARLEEYSCRLDQLDREIASLVATIRAEAEAEKARIIADAEARAARLRREAEQQIQAELQRVKQGLEREVVVTAVAIAEKLLREKTSETDQRTLADSFVKSLGQTAIRPGRVA